MGEGKDDALETFRYSLPGIKKKFMPQVLYLFGSRARGDNLISSDLDIVMVSEYFRDMKFLDRVPAVLELIEPPVGIDLLCYTPEEFEKKKEELGIVRESLKCKVEL